MRNVSFLLSVLAATAGLISCGKESAGPDNGAVRKSDGTVLNAYFEDFGTKTTLGGNDADGYDVLWTAGDEITVADESGTKHVYRLDDSSDGKKNGTFVGSESLTDGSYTAWYGTDGNIWPTEHTYEAGRISGSPMRAVFSVSGGAAEPLHFKNLGGLLRIRLDTGISVRKITVSSDCPMTGTMTVSGAPGAAPKTVIDSRGVIYASLSVADGALLGGTSGTAFYIPLPENSYPGFRVTVVDKDGGRYVKYLKNGASMDVGRSAITPVTLSDMSPLACRADVSVSQKDYLKSLQLTSGAILKDTGSDTVNPYFSNLAAIAMSGSDSGLALEYVKWYLDHLNADGSIDDFQADGETSRGSYDSKDSYAATFLIVIEKLVSEGHKDELTAMLASSGNSDGPARVAAAMLSCIDTGTATVAGTFSPENDDCLSVAKPDYDVKYLMDNCEVNRALKAAATLQDEGLLPGGTDYRGLLASNTAGIEDHLWSESNGMYDWFEGGVAGISSWDNFYPDAVAQMWPIIFGVLDPKSSRARSLYDSFTEHYPSWTGRHGYDTYHWAAVCCAASLMGDAESADTFLEYVWGANRNGKQKPWWYCAEAAWTILAYDNL